MKLQLIAAAALVAAGPATQAQSSVNLFALIDLNVTHYSAGSKAGQGSVTVMNDGTTNGLNGSRWGQAESCCGSFASLRSLIAVLIFFDSGFVR